VILILVAVAIFILARFLALALRFALSRKREFLADAGAVELTKNPDAMIGALRKIAGHSEIEAPPQVAEMFLDHPRAAGLAGLFSTHPSIDDRVAALVEHAGGRDLPPRIEAAPSTEGPAGPWQQTARGPWG
jgi:heat shock protein HtpX